MAACCFGSLDDAFHQRDHKKCWSPPSREAVDYSKLGTPGLPDMRQRDDLDSSTMLCPCGDSFTNDSYTTYQDIEAWMKEHAAHSSGHIAGTISDDGMRCLAKDAARTYRRRL